MRADDSATRFDIVPWFHGRILDMSEGSSKTFPHFISHIDCGIAEADKCGIFADGSMDGVFSSYLLHLLAESERGPTLKEWARIVRDGGHIVIHIPEGSIGYPELVALIEATGRGFDVVHYERRDDGAALFAFRLMASGKHRSHLAPAPEKTCAVVRLGAFGDLIQASSILPHLKAAGYHITFYCSDHGHPVIEHDPHVDRFIIQGRDEMPPNYLGAFWEHEKKKYYRWINLSESVEGSLLAAPGSSAWGWPNAVREKRMDRNYLEFTHEIAEVPPPYRPMFYATPDEKLWAREKARSYGKRNILWSLSGSSVHKTWPHLDSVVAAILLLYPDVHIVMVGDDLCQVLEAGWQNEKRVHRRSGEWTIRQSMAFAQVADLIIGTETGLLNAAGMMDTPKIVTLSHSSEEMLTKHWKNAIALSQPKGAGCPMQPCRMLHQNWSACMRNEDGSAQCQHEITPEMMMAAVASFMGKPQLKVA